ncbi:MAG: gamma-glutamyltransferase [Chloroflexi bacterium]|nr:gamma-glutamyltransferase [Chloroflexota bacterium]MDA1269957.1 gamma-glutamyltransferase [Chloroflexota bacterium]
MAIQTPHHELEQGDLKLPETGRPVVRSTKGVISSGHYLTSMAGMRMLMNGGNAFDAMAAAGFAAAVIEPIASYSLAAEGVFMVYDAASDEMLSLSGQGGAPGKATADFYKSQGMDRIPTGPGDKAHFSFTVPGVVEAFISLLERYGSLPIDQVLAPAIDYAENGIPHYEYMLERLKSKSTPVQFDNYPPGGWDVFFNDRQVPQPGDLLVQPGLANTLKAMSAAAVSGDRKAGLQAARDVFYKGSVAKTIVESSAKVGGILSMDDLANYKSQFGEPVSSTFAGHEILGHDTWSQGPMLQQTLNILENFDLKAMGHNSPTYIHTVCEALKQVFGDREAYYADPDYAEIPIDGLLSKEYAAERAGLIDPERAYPEQPAPGDPWKHSKRNGAVPTGKPAATGASNGASDPSSHEGTTHVSVLDAQGNMVCGTISGGAFAKSVFFPELGCCLSTRIEMFNCEEGHPNVVEPGKRPRTTLINYMARKDGQPVMTIGCPGGDNQAQANVQLVLNVLLFGMDPQQAVEAPRFASQSVENSFYPHTYLPGRLDLEPGIPESTADALRALGHQIGWAANCGLGATVSARDPQTGHLATGGDPRRACYAIGL